MSKAVVLLSGGQDSTTCLFWARTHFDEVLCVSINYGQRHRFELEAAAQIVELVGSKHIVLHVPALGELADSALVGAAPIKASGGLVDSEMPEGLPTSFVPGRNALLLAHAASVAVKFGAHDIVTGVCETDYSGYPDCRRTFVDALEAALELGMPSSSRPLRILTPLMWLSKAETVRMARRLSGCWEGLARSVTCYYGKRPGCGECPACVVRARGFAEAGERDPAA